MIRAPPIPSRCESSEKTVGTIRKWTNITYSTHANDGEARDVVLVQTIHSRRVVPRRARSHSVQEAATMAQIDDCLRIALGLK